jgi:hypothetical protein
MRRGGNTQQLASLLSATHANTRRPRNRLHPPDSVHELPLGEHCVSPHLVYVEDTVEIADLVCQSLGFPERTIHARSDIYNSAQLTSCPLPFGRHRLASFINAGNPWGPSSRSLSTVATTRFVGAAGGVHMIMQRLEIRNVHRRYFPLTRSVTGIGQTL